MTRALIGDRFQGQWATVHPDGSLRLARDVVREYMGRVEYLPEHAVLEGDRLVWKPHSEGDTVEPLIEGYDRPGCEYRLL